MQNTRKIISEKEFKRRVKTKLMQVNKNINEDDLYFSCTLRGYYITYMPNYPETSAADFIIYQDLNGSISLDGNLNSLVPTIAKYEDIIDFEDRL